MVSKNDNWKSVVYVLGAGMSQALYTTAPLMAQLLPEALKLFDEHPLFSQGSWNDRALRIKSFLKDFYNLNPDSLPNLEDVLTLLDGAITEGRPLSRDYNLYLLRTLREDLVYTICETLRQKLDDNTTSSEELMRRQYLIERFVRRLEVADGILSLNYDIIIDNALLRYLHCNNINYGLSVRYNLAAMYKGGRRYGLRPITYSATLQTGQFFHLPPLYKLHGSLNWLYCPSCQQVDVTIGMKGVQFIYADGTDFGCPDCHASYEPLIITPTLLKEYNNMLLREVWRQAEDKLAKADDIVFIGYSLPDADAQLRSMLSLALFKNRARRNERGDIARCKIHVVGKRPPDSITNNNDMHKRYIKLFGEVDYHSNGLQGYIEELGRTEEIRT